MFNKALQYFVRYQQLLMQTAIKKPSSLHGTLKSIPLSKV